MTGPEFALSIIASMIAAVILDILRNPAPPVYRQEPNHFFQNSREFFKKLASRIWTIKKEVSPRPTTIFLKKSSDARARLTDIKHSVPLSLGGTCNLCNYESLCPQQHALKKI